MASRKQKNRDPWTDPEPRYEPVSETPPVTHQRKNTRRWCKGVVGREHVPETVRDHHYHWGRDCHWSTWGPSSDRWWCYHVVQCTVCGKHLQEFLPKEECPTWLATPSPPPHAAG